MDKQPLRLLKEDTDRKLWQGDLSDKQEDILMKGSRKNTRSKTASAANSERQEKKAREQYEKLIQDWDQKLKPQIDAIRSSQRLSKEDFSIRINAIG